MAKLPDPEYNNALERLSVPEHPLLNKAKQLQKSEVLHDLGSCDFSNSPKVKRERGNEIAQANLGSSARNLQQSNELAEELSIDTSLGLPKRLSLSQKYRIWHSLRLSPKTILDRLIDFIVRLLKSLENWLFGESARKNQKRQKKSASSGPGAQAR